MNKYQKIICKIAKREMEEWNDAQLEDREKVSFWFSRKTIREFEKTYEQALRYKNFWHSK